MVHELSDRLVIAIALSELFDLAESDEIFSKNGVGNIAHGYWGFLQPGACYRYKKFNIPADCLLLENNMS